MAQHDDAVLWDDRGMGVTRTPPAVRDLPLPREGSNATELPLDKLPTPDHLRDQPLPTGAAQRAPVELDREADTTS